jgi:hypothetical protein
MGFVEEVEMLRIATNHSVKGSTRTVEQSAQTNPDACCVVEQ